MITNTKLPGETVIEIQIDHVMFPVYYNNPFLDIIENEWRQRDYGKVFTQPQGDMFKGVYQASKSFYVEYLSTVDTETYWSNSIYLIVPKKYWSAIENPAMQNEHFLVPSFGSGYQLVSPDFPYLNSSVSKIEIYDGFTILISKALENEILNIAGEKWTLPKNGKIQVDERLVHLHDMAVIDEDSKLVAPLFEANPILRNYF